MNSKPHIKRLLTVSDVQEILSIGRTRIFSLISSGELESVRIGSSRRITSDALDDFVNRLVAESQFSTDDETGQEIEV